MSARIEIERAMKLRDRELRARQLADMAVAIAMEDSRKHGDPHRTPLRFAHDVAKLAASILIERIYSEDRELVELRELLEQYKNQLERLITVSRPMLTIPIMTEQEVDR